jgi:O-antigen ligase
MRRRHRRLDIWRCLAALVVGALAAASFNFLAGATWPSVLRYVLLALLTAYVLLLPRSRRHLHHLQGWRALGSASTGACVFLVMAAASTAWSVAPTLTALQVLALLAIVISVALTATRRWIAPARLVGDVRLVYWVLLVLTVPSLAGGVLHAPFAYGYLGRYQGIFQSATTTGMLAALVALLSWGLAASSRRPWPYWVGLALALATLLMSQSRGAIVAMAGAAAWMVFRSGGRRGTRAAAGVVISFAALFLVPPTVGHEPPSLILSAIERFTPERGVDYSTKRIDAWNRSLELWRTEPLLGHGFRTGEVLFERERQTSTFAFAPDTAHNGYLQLLLEVGLVGLVLFLVAMAKVLRAAPRRAPPLHASLFGVVLFGLLMQFTESSVFGTGAIFPFVYWLLVAAAVVAEAHRREFVSARQGKTKLAKLHQIESRVIVRHGGVPVRSVTSRRGSRSSGCG